MIGSPSDYEPCADVSERLLRARKEAIRAAFNYRHTHWPSESPHVADDGTVERCYAAFLKDGAWTEVVVAADAAVASVLDQQRGVQ